MQKGCDKYLTKHRLKKTEQHYLQIWVEKGHFMCVSSLVIVARGFVKQSICGFILDKFC